MADITAEIAWMRTHASKQATENEVADHQRWEHERQAELAHCRFCPHPKHHEYLVGASLAARGVVYDAVTSDDWELAMVVSWCDDESCLCGVPSCVQCGDRSRNRHTGVFGMYLCPACGAVWRESPIA